MLERVDVHERIQKRHPELSAEDVREAWAFSLHAAVRHRSAFDDYLVIGVDGQGRLIEMIAVRKDDGWLIYHANTPPTKRVLDELGLAKGNHHGA